MEVTMSRKNAKYKRGNILQLADKLTSSDRQNDHGDFADNAKVTAEFWTTYKGVEFSPHDVPVMLALLKVARIKQNPEHVDNYVDMCGYGALAGEQVPARGKQ